MRRGGQPERRLHTASAGVARGTLSQLTLERLERRHAVRQSDVQRIGVRRDEMFCSGKLDAVLKVVAVVPLSHRSSEKSGSERDDALHMLWLSSCGLGKGSACNCHVDVPVQIDLHRGRHDRLSSVRTADVSRRTEVVLLHETVQGLG